MLEKLDLIQIRQVIEGELKPVKRSLRNLEADSRKTRKDINLIIQTFDNEYLDLRKRVDHIEKKIGITT